MKKDNYDALAMAIAVAVGCLILLFVMVGTTTPRCIESNCNKKQVDGSGYCEEHQPKDEEELDDYEDVSTPTSDADEEEESEDVSDNPSSSTESASSEISHAGGTLPSGSSGTSYSGTPSYKGNSNGTGKKPSPYQSYDDGYDAIYDDGDYDSDRYRNDPDYASGVDDAMDELDW